MKTLQRTRPPVQPEPAPVDSSDAAWWAAESDGPEASPEPITTRDWLAEEAAGLSRRAREEGDPAGALAMAADELRGVAGEMTRSGHETAADFIADPHTTPGPAAGGLEVRFGGAPRRSPLAAALDVLAAWYSNLETDAGDLAAWHLAWLADSAESFEAGTAGEYFEAEAAFLMASEDVFGGDEELSALLDCFL